jgi:hypothetical protein
MIDPVALKATLDAAFACGVPLLARGAALFVESTLAQADYNIDLAARATGLDANDFARWSQLPDVRTVLGSNVVVCRTVTRDATQSHAKTG